METLRVIAQSIMAIVAVGLTIAINVAIGLIPFVILYYTAKWLGFI